MFKITYFVFPILLLILFDASWCFRTRIPIGVLVDQSDPTPATVVRHTLWQKDRESTWPKEYVVEVLQETIDMNDASQIDRAVCRLMKQGIMALVAATNPLAYQMLVTYSNTFELPLISPSFPDVSMDLRPSFSASAQPSVSRAVVDLLRFYKWPDFVYLYDADDGPDALQKIFQLGYRALRFNLTGIMRTSHPEEANRYLRKLDSVKKYHNFHVILDMDHALAKDIIIRHVHDVHVGKANFHFLIKRPVLEEFWTDNAGEFGALNVFGFTVLKSDRLKKFQDMWKSIPSDIWPGAGTSNLNMTTYLYRDSAMILSEALKKLLKRQVVPHNIEDADAHNVQRNCLQDIPQPLPLGRLLAAYIKQGIVAEGLSGRISFDPATGQRRQYELLVMNSTRKGSPLMGKWSDTRGYQPVHLYPHVFQTNLPEALPRTEEKKIYKVISVLSRPFMMLKNNLNASDLGTNDAYEGFCKDLLDILAKELKFEYELHVLDVGAYGDYDESVGEWTGATGELIRGKADMVVADLHVTGRRQRVVEFADPFAAVTLSLLMKNPQRVSSGSWAFFVLSAFSKEIWVCLIVSAVVVTALFFFLSKFTGAPDNIEAAYRVWGKKFTVPDSAWFIVGSALFQGTGIYPRSTSCRILGSTWWCFTLVIFSLYIASLTSQMYMESTDRNGNSQLSRLHSLSLESIIKEAVQNDWPKVGVMKISTTRQFIKKSTIPVYKDYTEYLKRNPDMLTNSIQEGVDMVRESKGEYAFIMESLISDYYALQEPCDVVSIHDRVAYTTYAIAMPLWSPLKFDMNEALRVLAQRGELGHLNRQWFVESNHCSRDEPKTKDTIPVTLGTMSGLFYILIVGLALASFVGSVQYYFKTRRKTERRTQLSFEEVAMGSTMPLPPPPLVLEQPAEEDNGLIDGWAERKLVQSSFVGEDESPHRPMISKDDIQ